MDTVGPDIQVRHHGPEGPRRRAVALLCALVLAAIVAVPQSQETRGQADRATSHEDAYRANNIGVALLEQFNYSAAVESFRKALRLHPSLITARVNLAIALFYASDLDGAQREAAAAAQQLSSAPQPQYMLGLIARSQNRIDAAIAAFQSVQQIDAHDVGTLINLGQLYLQQRQYPDAIAAFRAALAEEPYNVTAAYNLGLALTRAGQRDEGQQTMERSQVLRASGYGTIFSSNYLEQGRYAEAIASTGAERELVDRATPEVKFTATPAARIAATPPPAGPPIGRRFTAEELVDGSGRTITEALGGGLTLLDFDGDGDLDLFVVGTFGQKLFRNDAGTFVDVTEGSGLATSGDRGTASGCVAGDYDNDGRPDLLVLRYGGNTLYHNEGNGKFSDATQSAQLPSYPHLSVSAAFVDFDHDGDLDIVIAGLADLAPTAPNAGGLTFPDDFPSAPHQLLRNNGDGTFTDVTAKAELLVKGHAVAVVPTDYDNRRDVDLLFVNEDGPPVLFKNLRDGTFRDTASAAGLRLEGRILSVAAADVNKDDYPDFFFGRAGAPGLLAMSDGRARFTMTVAPAGTSSATIAQFVDYDNDGLLDLLTWSAEGPRLFRNLGDSWADVTDRAFPRQAGSDAADLRLASPRALAAADLDGDGDRDLIGSLTSGTVTVWRNDGGNRDRSVRVQLAGRVSNRTGIGAKIDLRAGSLKQRIETSATTPAVAPADIVFGLGRRSDADVIRVLWPSGVVQAEISGAKSERAALTPRLSIEELDRKPSSCPFLYTWNGQRFAFVTDFMGGGEMGYWESPEVRNTPDPDEYVRITDHQLQPRNGRYEIRVTNELEEAVFVDRLQLLAIAHPADVEVYPNEGMTDPPKSFVLHTTRGAHPPARAVDDHGHDVRSRIERLDGQYADDFAVSRIRGYAEEHTLTLDLGEAISGRALLLLTGWTDYAFSSDNVAAAQSGTRLKPPALQIRAEGRWQTVIPDVGIPVGRPQTVVVDLTGRVPPGTREVRIVTNMRIYWDQILVNSSQTFDALEVARLDPLSATLRWRGFSAEISAGAHAPVTYDYERVTLTSPWKVMPGRYTREGDVTMLLERTDDMFVIARPGDEIAVSFDAAKLLPLRTGWKRTFLLFADGFSKEMDINSASPDQVEPLPFHGMTRYPYGAPERYPDTAAHERYRAAYNTRVVAAPLSRLEVLERR
jgi:tetratricopeptide (TPR) repeat protein